MDDGLLHRKLEGAALMTHTKAPDAFHDFFANKPHHIHTTINDDFLHGCDLHEGDYGVPGSTIEWTYTVDGKKKKIKQKLEVVDEENKVMKFKCIEGDLMSDYDNFLVTFQVLPVSEGVCKVVWTFEYLKKRAGLPEPSGELDALIKIVKEIDEYHHSTEKEAST